MPSVITLYKLPIRICSNVDDIHYPPGRSSVSMRHICSSHEDNDQYKWSISSVHVRISSTHKEDYQHLWVSSVLLSDCSNEYGMRFHIAYCISSQASWILNILQSTAHITLYNVCSVHWRNTMSTSGGYHEYIPTCIISPWCTEHPQCTHDILLMYLWYPPVYSWYPPMHWTPLDVLMVSSQCYRTHIIQGGYSLCGLVLLRNAVPVRKIISASEAYPQ